MFNRNKEALEQRKRLTTAAKAWYGNNYNPGSLNPQNETKFFLNEDYIPYDPTLEEENSIINQAYNEIMTNPNPNYSPESKYESPLSDIDNQTTVATNYIDASNMSEAQRRKMLFNNQPFTVKLKPKTNFDWKEKADRFILNKKPHTTSWPSYTLPAVGRTMVKINNEKIENAAQKYNVDPDILRAVMYTENATGHWFGGNKLRDITKTSNSQMPMNINGNLWSKLDDNDFDTNNAQQNIDNAALLLSKISDTQPGYKDLKSIGTLWNNMGAQRINKLGEWINDAYNNKYWEKYK